MNCACVIQPLAAKVNNHEMDLIGDSKRPDRQEQTTTWWSKKLVH